MEKITVTQTKRAEEVPASAANKASLHAVIGTRIVREPSMIYYASKRLIDISLSVLGILLLIPVLLIIAMCIKLDDGGPILHFREIIGQHGRRFFALKFRTMIPDADAYLAQHPELMRKYQQNMKLKHDPLITRPAKFLPNTTLYDLPQLLNL